MYGTTAGATGPVATCRHCRAAKPPAANCLALRLDQQVGFPGSEPRNAIGNAYTVNPEYSTLSQANKYKNRSRKGTTKAKIDEDCLTVGRT